MAFTQFPHAPKVPPFLQHAQTPATDDVAMPVHPLLRPLPSSRSQDETPYEHESERSSQLDDRRAVLHQIQLLNSERWAHHRTTHLLRQETARREQLEQQILCIRIECQGLANGLVVSARNLMVCETERMEVLRQLTATRSELEACQIALHEAFEEAQSRKPIALDMTPAENRKAQISKKKTSRETGLYRSGQIFEEAAEIEPTSSIYESSVVQPLFAASQSRSNLTP